MKIVELTKIVVAYRPNSFISGSFRYPSERARVTDETQTGIWIAFSDEYHACVAPTDIKEIQ